MSFLRAVPGVSIKKVRNARWRRKRGRTLEMASWFLVSSRCLSSVPRLIWQVSVLNSFPKSFKGGPCEFINLLSRVYLTEYIFHSRTSFNPLIPGQLVSLWIHPVSPDEVVLLWALWKQTNTSWIFFFVFISGAPLSHHKNKQNFTFSLSDVCMWQDNQ